MRKLIVANWKMALGLKSSLRLAKFCRSLAKTSSQQLVICPSYFALAPAQALLRNSGCALGAQDVSWQEMGAFTGEVAAAALAELGCAYVIIGHSERRQFLGESDRLVNLKLKAVLAQSKLTPIICVGENWQERTKSKSQAVVKKQLQAALAGFKTKRPLIIAYEPVWAIGTGKVIEVKEAQLMHRFINKTAKNLISNKNKLLILYGGSVNPDNAKALLALPEVDGLLVGAASWQANSFKKIAKIK